MFFSRFKVQARYVRGVSSFSYKRPIRPNQPLGLSALEGSIGVVAARTTATAEHRKNKVHTFVCTTLGFASETGDLPNYTGRRQEHRNMLMDKTACSICFQNAAHDACNQPCTHTGFHFSVVGEPVSHRPAGRFSPKNTSERNKAERHQMAATRAT